MSLRFACPSCGAAGSVDAALVGRSVRCKQCKYRFAIPGPGEAEDEGYALGGAIGGTPVDIDPGSGSASAFVPRRGVEPTASAPRKVKVKEAASGAGPGARRVRRHESGFDWRPWLIRGPIVVALTFGAIALFAPRGTWVVGCALLALGSLMVLAGYGVGAYGAFREDFLYGMLYLLVPLYAAYYLVTRWDDLWPWFACSTAGVALVSLGTEMLRWDGVGV